MRLRIIRVVTDYCRFLKNISTVPKLDFHNRLILYGENQVQSLYYASKPRFPLLKTFGFTLRNTINTILKFEHEKKRILEMSFRGQQGITRCHFMFFTIVLRRPTIWQVYERTTNSIDPLTISSFTFFERILPEVVFVVYSSFVPISEKKICF